MNTNVVYCQRGDYIIKIKLMPAIISTREGLYEALKDDSPILYFDQLLYPQFLPEDFEALAHHSFVLSDTKYKYGVMYLRTRGKYVFDPDLYEISDPYGLL